MEFGVHEMRTEWISSGIFIILLVGIIGSGCFENSNHEEEVETPWWEFPKEESSTHELSGYSEENTEYNISIQIQRHYVTNVSFNLTWEDEPDSQYGPRTYENQPDEFSFTVFTPLGEEHKTNVSNNTYGEVGEIFYVIEFTYEDIGNSSGMGEWEVIIHCGDCGDFYSTSFVGFDDIGNNWDFSCFYEYHSIE